MTRDFEELEEKLKTSKPTITGKEVKIDKDTYDTLNSFMNTSKRVIKICQIIKHCLKILLIILRVTKI